MESNGKTREKSGAGELATRRQSPIRVGSTPLPLAGSVFQVRHASVTRVVADAGKDNASYESIVAAAQALQDVDIVAWEEELQGLVSSIGIDFHPAPDLADAPDSGAFCGCGCLPSRRAQPRIAPTYQTPSWTCRIQTTWSLSDSFEAGLAMWAWMIRVARGLARVIEERYSTEACAASVRASLREVEAQGWNQPRIDSLAAAVAAACHSFDREVHRSSREPSLTYLRHAVLGLAILQGSATPFRRPTASVSGASFSLSRPPDSVPRPGPFCTLVQVSRTPSVNRLLRLLLTSAWRGDDPLAYPPRGGLSFSHTFRAPSPSPESATGHHASPTDIAVALAAALGLPWDRSVVSQTPARGGRWLPLLPILDGATKLTLMYPHWRAALRLKQRPWRIQVPRGLAAWQTASQLLHAEQRHLRPAPEISPMFVRDFSSGDGSDGAETEEGEGHGPRKEFFALLGDGWVAAFEETVDVSDAAATLSCARGDRRATVRVGSGSGSGLPGWRPGWQGRVWIEVDAAANGSASPRSAQTQAQQQLASESQSTMVELRVMEEDGAGGCWSVRLSSPASFAPSTAAQGLPFRIRHIASRCSPPLVPRAGTSTVSYSEGMRESPESVADMTAMGWFLGAALLHRCACQVPLAPLQVGLLLLDPDEEVSWSPSLADLVQWDEGLVQSVRQVISVPETKLQSQADAEGVTLSTPTPRPQGSVTWGTTGTVKGSRVHQAYLAHMIRATLHDAVAWQSEAVRAGFQAAVGGAAIAPAAPAPGAGGGVGSDAAKVAWPNNVLELFRDWGMGPVELTEVWSGESAGAPLLGRGTDIREFFHVVCDEDMEHETVLQEAVWETVSSWTASAQEAFLRFVTGVGKPPLPGSEVLRLSSPFLAYSIKEHRERLARLPEAHTCFNTLEIPNYRESLQAVRQADRVPLEGVDRDCKQLVAAKLRCAVLEGGASYGLDAIGATGRGSRRASASPPPIEESEPAASGTGLNRSHASFLPSPLPPPSPVSKESTSQRGPTKAQAVLSLELDD